MVTFENKFKASGQTVVVKVTIKYASENKVNTKLKYGHVSVPVPNTPLHTPETVRLFKQKPDDIALSQ